MSESDAAPSIDDKNATVLNIAADKAPAVAGTLNTPLDLADKYRDLKERFSLLSFRQKLMVGIAFAFLVVTILVITISGQKKDDYRILFSSVSQKWWRSDYCSITTVKCAL